MPFNYSYLPYSETGYFSGLVTDYLKADAKLDGLYTYLPSEEGIANAIKDRAKYPADRKTLVDVLTKQYTGLELSNKVQQNLQLLLADNTFTVCTAHQPNLLTGYLYFVYKILHAIRLAEELKKLHPEANFVPVYYMGSEDNDLDELGTFRYNGDRYVWDGDGQAGAVGRMKTAGLKRTLDELFALLGPPGEYCDQLKDCLTKAYLDRPTIGAATQYLVNELFGKYGLLILDPDEAAFKRAILPVLKDELLKGNSYRIVSEQIKKPGQYKAQAHPREINLFYLAEGLRERIERQEHKWVVLNTDISWTENELLNELDKFPERFSPNVILRPILQEQILPNVAFIGGGGEVAYWLQLRSLFEYYHVFYPAIFLRQSILWINKAASALKGRTGLQDRDVFIDKNKLANDFVMKNAGSDWQTRAESAAIEEILYRLKEKATKLDLTLNRSAEAAWIKIKHQLENLEKKMLRAEKRKMHEQVSRISRLKEHLFPGNSLQERTENFTEYYLQYGPSFFDVILQGLGPFAGEFLIIEDAQ